MRRRYCIQPTDKMRTATILLAVAAVVSASVVSDSDEWGSEESRRSTTGMPCPDECPDVYDPVCAKDEMGDAFRFENLCMLTKCRCFGKWLVQVPLFRCRDDSPGCPLNAGRPAQRDGGDDSDEWQGAPSARSPLLLQLQPRRHRTNALRHESQED